MNLALRTRITVLSAICLFLAGTAGAQQGQIDIPAIVSQASGAVVLLKGFDDSGSPVGQGSGFRVSGGRIATNAHVLAGSTRVEAFDKDGRLLGTSRYAEALSTTVDIAILPRLGSSGFIVPLAGQLPAVGEAVVVMGAPKGLANTVSNGIVSAIRDLDGQMLIQISAPISSGSSGGPVLNSRGQVIGVAVAMYRDAQNLNFAVPVADLFAVMESPAGQVPFPQAEDSRSRATAASARRPLVLGQTANGLLEVSDLALSSGARMDTYTFEGRAGQSVSLSLKAASFDATLTIMREIGDSVDVVEFDDDGGGGTDALVNVTLPATTTYVVVVVPHEESEGKLGAYTLDLRSGFRPVATSTRSAAGSGNDTRWVAAGQSNSAEYFYDRQSLRRPRAGSVRVWTRVRHNEPTTDDNGDTFDEELRETEISCPDRRYRSTQPHQYMRGSLVWSPSSSELAPWRAIVPNTLLEGLLEKVCGA